MTHSSRHRQKKKTGPLVRIVFWLSLCLLVARLIWVLPAAFDHHRTKQAAAQEAAVSGPKATTRMPDNSATH